ncbi:glycosyl transferase [Geotalea uraniireducens]|uniref:Glycosyl transferase n=1 Tax=Geotalea uraniireducens TaxID=351604 RepID=A0ABN6VSY9_9BACT|nr:glycosyltransferase family 2 protein [Geotalea uraniireducens]BDV42547.1 glycosyl transferase [Geotalea uraniireducens]
MTNISATIIARNEERNIGACLASLDFVAEIVVVDSGSSDRTEEICRADPRVRYYHHEWRGFGAQKNFAADQATHDWLLNIDADERVSPELRASILNADPTRCDGYRVARENYFGGRRIRHCGWYPDYNLRLYNRQRCRFGDRLVHEAVECPGPVGTLAGNLIHFTYAGIADYLQRMDRYSTLAAAEAVKERRRCPGLLAVVGRSLFTFFKMYILKRGILDGADGFQLSVLYACYTFAKYAKIRELLTAPNDEHKAQHLY